MTSCSETNSVVNKVLISFIILPKDMLKTTKSTHRPSHKENRIWFCDVTMSVNLEAQPSRPQIWTKENKMLAFVFFSGTPMV